MRSRAFIFAAAVAASLAVLSSAGAFAADEPSKETEAKTEAPAEVKAAPPTKADLQAAITKLAVSMNKLGDSVKALYEQRKAKDTAAIGDIYGRFCTDEDVMEEALGSFRNTYSGLRGDMDTYYRTWKAEVSAIKNEKIRKAGERRLVDFNENYDDLVKIIKEYDKELTSISSQLQDVRKYLKYDLRPAGVDQISGVLDDASDEIGDLKDSNSKVRKVLDQLPEKVEAAKQ